MSNEDQNFGKFFDSEQSKERESYDALKLCELNSCNIVLFCVLVIVLGPIPASKIRKIVNFLKWKIVRVNFAKWLRIGYCAFKIFK